MVDSVSTFLTGYAIVHIRALTWLFSYPVLLLDTKTPRLSWDMSISVSTFKNGYKRGTPAAPLNAFRLRSRSRIAKTVSKEEYNQ